MRSEHIEFEGPHGRLSARLDSPDEAPRAYGLFAHCFTCTKDNRAAVHICRELTACGLATLRFDFSGLGDSEGDFCDTNVTSNIKDLLAATAWLKAEREGAKLLIGHSLGGTAVLAAASRIPEARAVATIAAPSDPSHITKQFSHVVPEIHEKGEAAVKLAGRPFTIRRQFLDDVARHTLHDDIAHLNKALMVFHSPVDDVVGIENAGHIFAAAKHPKSFISLDRADHLVHRDEDTMYIARVLSAWVSRYL